MSLPVSETSLIGLTIASALAGCVHTVVGPDHYVPFIMMAKARGWSLLKTTWIALFCGVGHVGSSIVIGLIGVAAGATMNKIELFESFRGDIVAWGLIAFGLTYCAWGVRRMIRKQPHSHSHVHDEGARHEHTHTHYAEHTHAHGGERADITPWILFTLFVFGPCEPLIPIMMLSTVGSAGSYGAGGIALVAGAFVVTTLVTILGLTLLGLLGLRLSILRRFENSAHAVAGATIALCGVAIQLGL